MAESPIGGARRTVLFLALLFSVAPGCRCAAESGRTAVDGGEDQVRPVYGREASTPDPRATRLCDALYALPEQRRAACCGRSPGLAFAAECARNVTAALRGGAVMLDSDKLASCRPAQETALQGCEWVGPAGPPLPEACQGLFTGQLDPGASCRSSLECKRGLRCRGLGPTQAGVCDAPGAPTTACDLGADTLAVYTRQELRDHPECAGVCLRRVCVAPLAEGGACTLNGQCGADAHCASGRCVAERFAHDGEQCVPGACAPSSFCRGTCQPRKQAGAPCTTDAECLGACITADAGASNTCGMRCGF